VVNIDQKSRHWTGRFRPVSGITVIEIMKIAGAILQNFGRMMPETYSSSRFPLHADERPHCPKCSAQMTLVLISRGPSGFDIRTFDCASCDHAHIVTVATKP
jgi:hypothetical protein